MQAIDGVLSRAVPELQAAQDIGLVTFYRDRPTAQINEEVLLAHERVDILEISLHSMRQVTRTEWRRCEARNIRVILLDPHFPASAPLALQRDREEDQQEGKILEEVRHALDKFPPEWFEASSAQPQVKLAQVMPTLSYFRIDDIAYVSPYLHEQVGDATVHFQLRAGGHFFGVLTRHFDALWEDEARVMRANPDEIRDSY